MTNQNNPKIRINRDSLNSGQKLNWHYIKSGTSIYRILPPKEVNGYPYHKWILCWGLLDPERGTIRPYASSLMTEEFCPIDDYHKKLKTKLEVLMAEAKSLKEEDPKKEILKERISKINKCLFHYKLRYVYIYNAIDQSGKVGLLVVPFTAHRKLQKVMNDYISTYNQDPTSLGDRPDDSGVWMKFTRTGERFDTTYDVEINKITIKDPSGDISYKDDRSPLPKQVQDKFYDELHKDLTTIYPLNTPEKLKTVLLLNLKERVKENEELLIAGYDDFSKLGEQKISDKVNDNTNSKETVNPKYEEKEIATPSKETITHSEPVSKVEDKSVEEESDDLMLEAERIISG